MSQRTRERDLEHLFGRYGPIEEVKIIYSDGRSRGFGFVYFEDVSDAKHVCHYHTCFHHLEIDSHFLFRLVIAVMGSYCTIDKSEWIFH